MAADARGQLKNAFLDAFRVEGTVLHACKVVGISRAAVYEWRHEDEAFAAAWKLAEEDATDALVREARRRAVEGTLEPVYQGGEQVGTIRRYGDTLLIFLIKGARPEIYRDNVSVDHRMLTPVQVVISGEDNI